MVLLLCLYLLLGALGGILIGLIGTGSSLIILPSLSLIFPHFFPADIALRLAIATSVSTLAVGAIVGAIAHSRHQKPPLTICLSIIPGCTIGSLLAPLISHHLRSDILHYYIGFFILAIALTKLWQELHPDARSSLRPIASTPILIGMSLICALLSGIAGIALGVLLIPFLNRYLEHKTSMTVSLVLASLYAVIVSIGYMVSGIHAHVTIPWTVGYVYLPAFFSLTIGMTIFTPLGSALSHRIPGPILRRIFYGFLLIAALVVLSTPF